MTRDYSDFRLYDQRTLQLPVINVKRSLLFIKYEKIMVLKKKTNPTPLSKVSKNHQQTSDTLCHTKKRFQLSSTGSNRLIKKLNQSGLGDTIT